MVVVIGVGLLLGIGLVFFPHLLPLAYLGGGGVPGPGKPPSSVLVAVRGLALVLAIGLLLIVLARVAHWLRERANPTYWEATCWTLVAIGIVVRQVISVDGTPNLQKLSVSGFAVSAIVSIAVLPVLMRWINRIPRQQGLLHVALPFSLGFFLDLAKALSTQFQVGLPWGR